MQLFKGDKLVDKRGKPLGFEVTNSAGEKSVLKKDLVKARSYFEAAATRGHVEAAFQAAHLYAQSEPLSVGECQVGNSKRARLSLSRVLRCCYCEW